MRTAIDTNVISALWSKEMVSADVLVRLGNAKMDGGLVIAGPVYAELLAYPNASIEFLTDFLKDTGVTVDFEFPSAVWLETGTRFARYATRRRASTGKPPRRLLADFMIGSHALLHADRLMTLDPAFYRQDFAELRLL